MVEYVCSVLLIPTSILCQIPIVIFLFKFEPKCIPCYAKGKSLPETIKEKSTF